MRPDEGAAIRRRCRTRGVFSVHPSAVSCVVAAVSRERSVKSIKIQEDRGKKSLLGRRTGAGETRDTRYSTAQLLVAAGGHYRRAADGLV